MGGLTKRQARLLKRQIRKQYGRNYIPVITGDNTLSIGDILLKKRDIVVAIDSSAFSNRNTEFVEGRKTNQNITSSSSVNITTKFKGQAVLPERFDVEEAGLAVDFTSENQMFLKVMGIRQQSIKNFVEFRKELLSKYVKGELSSKVYVVRGLVYADKYYLQYSGSKGGTITFNLDAQVAAGDADINADFSFKWKKEVGFNIDGRTGGVLAYRVSGVRLKRHLIPQEIQTNILSGMAESEALDMVAFEDRQRLFDEDALEIVDLTDEVLLYNEDEMA
ncbi:hypothetical protein [Winogradskyella sp.]|uniref:hypothetical protein n=1 Tax=Winogradskyella sp. TaxID=1883156 RepID=UPI00262C1057|nr:hypothetical protein [Winogradskyella sp.]